MREIIFRGKWLDNGAWLEGNLLFDEVSGVAAIVTYINLSGGVQDLSETNVFQVDPATIGEYTGLTDKNGVKIFEGDIVNYNNGLKSEIFKVVYNEKWARFAFTKPNTVFATFNLAKCEVVGNVFDDPELLEGGVNNG